MRIVVDTNVVFSAMLNTNSRIARIFLYPKTNLNFYATERLLEEIENHSGKLMQLSGYSEGNFNRVLTFFSRRIRFINLRLILKGIIEKTLLLTQDVDIDDSMPIWVDISNWGAIENEKKFGKLEGEVRIRLDSVDLNNSKYSWSQIDQVKFGVFAILGEKLWTDTYPIARYYGGPAYSQGLDSFIEFKFEGEKAKVFFQLESPSHKVELSRMMRLLFFDDRIDLSTTYLGLYLKFEEIQELKQAKIKYLEDQQSKFSS